MTQAGHVTAGAKRAAYHLGWGLRLRASRGCHCGHRHPAPPAPEQTQRRDPETPSRQVGVAPISLPASMPLGLSPSQVTVTAFYARTLYKLVVYFIF